MFQLFLDVNVSITEVCVDTSVSLRHLVLDKGSTPYYLLWEVGSSEDALKSHILDEDFCFPNIFMPKINLRIHRRSMPLD
jgi:hypothetical protein